METLNRTATKIARSADRYTEVDPAAFIAGIARNVARESFRPRPSHTIVPIAATPGPSVEREHKCLDRCLDELPPHDRELILKYYEGEKREKITNRAHLAVLLNISGNALRLRIHRIVEDLRPCVFGCLKGNQPKRVT